MADPRQFVYEVTEVWGFSDYDEPPVKVGDTLIDVDKGRGEEQWDVVNFETGERSGWLALYKGTRAEFEAAPSPKSPNAEVGSVGAPAEGATGVVTEPSRKSPEEADRG